MALRKAVPITFKAHGLSDTIDATNAFPGAMQQLANLIPSPSSKGMWVPRPASTSLTSFASFTNPMGISCLKVIGNIAYGLVASGRFVGKDEPFAFNLLTSAFETITGVLAANCPTTQPTSGDWTPPTCDVVAGRILFTHPGFPGGAVKFGWLDVSGFTSTGITGTLHTSTLIDTLSSNPINAGWAPGMTVTGANIPAGATIVSMTATSITISAAATAGGAGVALTVAGGGPTTPQWGAGDTNTTNLASVPVAVAQYGGRAWFAVDVSVVYSDAGAPCQVSSATQALLFRNGIVVTALAGLPLYSAVQGGMIQSLLAFQGSAVIQQITGDILTTNLQSNALNVATGTLAPNTITPTPYGVAFVAPDGVRIIDFSGKVSDPIGDHGQGIVVPFLYAVAPSRMAAAFNQNVLRISVQNGNANGLPTQEYWFDLSAKSWTGPHTFPAALIQPWNGTVGNTFVVVGSGINAQLWRSDVKPSLTSTYTENGVALSWAWQTSLLPDNERGEANAMLEATMAFQLPSTASVSVSCINERSAVLDSVTVTGPGVATIWGAFVWGGAPWSAASVFQQYRLPWRTTLTFKQASILATGVSSAGLSIGNLYMKPQILGYDLTGVA